MDKPTLALVLVPLFLGGARRDTGSAPRRAGDEAALALKEEKLILEYLASADEAALIVEAESEQGLASVEVRSPGDSSMLALRRARDSRETASGLSGFSVETAESSLETLLATYVPGVYELRARTVDGRLALGQARFSHELLPEPAVLYPRTGDVGVATNAIMGWIPDPEALSYQVGLEQGETDLMVATVTGGTSSFQVPEGILAPGTKTRLELGAIGRNGNITLTEVVFTTR